MQTYVAHSRQYLLTDALHTSVQPKIYKIKDLPAEQKPREKLLAHGPSVLSVQELVAVLLTVGTKKEEVLAMSSRVVHEYGERSLMSQKDAARLAADMDIPLTKAAQLVACAELGRRFFAKNENGVATIRTAKDVFEYTKDMHGLSKEHLRGLYLNAHHKVIHDEVISIGTVNASIIHPREVFKPALEYAAVAMVLVHNHPSGSTTPSEADIDITQQLVHSARIIGIDLLDHVIVTKDDYASVPAQYGS